MMFGRCNRRLLLQAHRHPACRLHFPAPLPHPRRFTSAHASSALVTGLALLACVASTAPLVIECEASHTKPPLPRHLVVHLAAMINGIIDLPQMDEHEEQEIFEDAVDKIIAALQDFLPASYWTRILTDKSIPAIERDMLRLRLVTYLQDALHLAYLSVEDQHLVVHAVVAIVADAMGPTTLATIVAQPTPPLHLVGIFIRGAMGIENVAHIRDAFHHVLDYSLPIAIPKPIEHYIVDVPTDALVGVLNHAIEAALVDCFGASPRYVIARASDFHEVLRAKIVTLLEVKTQLHLCPLVLRRRVIHALVDTYFKLCVKPAKIDAAIAPFLAKTSGEHPIRSNTTLASEPSLLPLDVRQQLSAMDVVTTPSRIKARAGTSIHDMLLLEK
ncbi:hypothetical protein SDRG_11336 [Saprolegnia diclina VS20]|uniref:Uncharacterized protein n=1 Tax=Saprolegnia diclina (strain VS20) TaxID=1156394 RepID=T0PZ59_SAPDV|nr:hypothetical protein SDRG_11336 [Saprolegnia diclina VS20]EQC30854.1 hypothetical protein SDRG_11336 [Saprolegnia diclina VS20]|eukprot:XP_008615592.1 hypothetical protein SDRG_11336 [Saprolegnia diclina VS20]